MTANREPESELRLLLQRFQLPRPDSEFSYLTDVAIDIYLHALARPLLTRDLDQRYGRGAVAIAREQLAVWQLVFDYKTTVGRTIAALPPQHSWTARAADFTWTVQEAPDLLHELADTGDRAVDAAHQLCLDISDLASQLYTNQHTPDFSHRTSLKSGEQIAVALSQLVTDADVEVLAMSRGPRLPHLAVIWEALERHLLSDGLAYRRIVGIDEIVEHGLAIVRRDVLKAGVQLLIAAPEAVNSTFYVFDGQTALIHHQNDSGEITSHRRTVNGLSQKHHSAEARSIPAISVVRVLQEGGEGLRRRAEREASENGQWLLDRRIANGKFAHRRSDWDEEELFLVDRELLDLELLVRTPEGHSLPNYQVDFAKASARIRKGWTDDGPEPCLECWCSPDMCRCS